MPDSRLDEGLRCLTVSTDDGEFVPAADVLPVLVEGVGASCG